MTVQPKFTNSKPVILNEAPVVLRFAGLFPRDLGKFKMHDERGGGDLDHVDQELSRLNQVLAGEPGWQQQIRGEIAEMRRHNHEEHLRALKAKSRMKDARKLEAEGPADPWRSCSRGPLREGIFTVNKDWFGGAGLSEWDPERVSAFRKTAMSFLRENFPNGQLRYASAHVDEEAYHIHFVVAVWTEKPSANRGHQILLQASENPLIKSYEHAQDLAGEAFETIGITRGERRAEARRQARAEGKPLPERRQHVPPSKWRAEERLKAQAEKKRILGDAQDEAKAAVETGRDLAKATVKKSRKRAVKEARARKQRAAREAAKMIRRRDTAEAEAVQNKKAADAANALKKKIVAEVGVLEPRVKGYEARAEEAAEKYRAETAARKAEEEKRARVIQERQQAEQVLNATKAEKSDLAAQLQQMVQHRRQAEKAAAEARAARLAEEKRLQEAEEKVRLKATVAEVITDAIESGLDLVAEGAICWREASADQQAGLTWGVAAPDTKGARAETLKEIRPAMRIVTRIAQLVARTVKRVLAKERQKLKQDADYVRGLRQKWAPEDDARLSGISRGEPGNGPV
ncbi:plasmid recombination protein [Leisingera sp. McT4-56]|nr:plasmid recombination protein [Leisingera sp. McT4-56]